MSQSDAIEYRCYIHTSISHMRASAYTLINQYVYPATLYDLLL